jgi:hypothetical protein
VEFTTDIVAATVINQAPGANVLQHTQGKHGRNKERSQCDKHDVDDARPPSPGNLAFVWQ